MEKITKIFLALSLLGILFLLFLSSFLEPKTMKISEINERNLNQQVRIEGRIIGVRDFPSKNFQLIALQDETGNITVTAFSAQSLDISGSSCVVIGRVSEYNQELQINAEKIIKS